MHNFEITKREVLASISIIAVMILVGILISAKITERQMDRNEVYNKAVKIDSQEMFSYGMRTNVGNAFIYGTLQAVDPVSYPEIDGSYMYVEKIKKLYTMHTYTVAHTDANGNTTYTIETYWSKVVDASPLRGGHPGGQNGQVFGIVEFEDGVRRVGPSSIKFCDEENAILCEMAKHHETLRRGEANAED